MALVWKNVEYTGTGVSSWRKLIQNCFCCGSVKTNKVILQQLCGHVSFGEIVALMGPSGAGKSTLFNCLTQGKYNNGFEGKIYLSTGERRGENDNGGIHAVLIVQDEKDHLLMNLTVAEAILYASNIKNPSISRREHRNVVETRITDLDLEDCKNNLIVKCSGGQKKRIVIAMELSSIQLPKFLFLDEPTSGLDSCAGFQVICLLAELAKNHNMAIITTIHQPSFEIFKKFSQAYIISATGHCLFQDMPSRLAEYLSRNNYCIGEQFNNPADAILKIASSVSREPRLEDENDPERQELKLICARMTENIKTMYSSFYADVQNGRNECVNGICQNGSKFHWYSLWCVLGRSATTGLWRQKKLIFIRLLLHAVVAGVLAGLYSRTIGQDNGCIVAPLEGIDPKNCSCNLNIKNESVSSQNVKFQFFTLLFLMFASLMPTVLTFPSEIKIFINEHRNGWYTCLTYYISKTITEIPVQFVYPFCYTYFLYWYTGQIGIDEWYSGFYNWRYNFYLGVTIICCFIAQGWGFLIGIICVNSFSMSIIISSSVLLFLFLFSGFFVKIAVMSGAVQVITYFSFIRFGFEALLVTLFGFHRCPKTTVFPDGSQHPMIPGILYIFDLDDNALNSGVYWLVGHLILIRLLAFLALKNLVDPTFLRPGKLVRNCFNKTSQDLNQGRSICKKVVDGCFCVLKWYCIVNFALILIGFIASSIVYQINKNDNAGNATVNN